MSKQKPELAPVEVRPRHEPPTIDEAVVAAQGLSDDIDQQSEIAALLMGVPEQDVRPAVQRLSAGPRHRPEDRRLDSRARPVVVTRVRRFALAKDR